MPRHTIGFGGSFWPGGMLDRRPVGGRREDEEERSTTQGAIVNLRSFQAPIACLRFVADPPGRVATCGLARKNAK